jgi:predicted metal-dependent hydrolase
MGKITISDGKNTVDCIVKRGKRKRTMAMQVAMNGKVTVMIPRYLDINIAERFAEKKVNWIRKQQDIRKQMQKMYPVKELVSGESVAIFGRTYRLMITRKKLLPETCNIKHKRLVVNVRTLSKIRIKNMLATFFKSLTLQQIHEGAKHYAPQLGVKIHKVYASNQAKRWGSCSRKGDLRINWKLAMAPLPVFNYVVAHEICHLKYHNHSQHFWSALRSIMPDYDKNRNWLKDNAGLITVF